MDIALPPETYSQQPKIVIERNKCVGNGSIKFVGNGKYILVQYNNIQNHATIHINGKTFFKPLDIATKIYQVIEPLKRKTKKQIIIEDSCYELKEMTLPANKNNVVEKIERILIQ